MQNALQTKIFDIYFSLSKVQIWICEMREYRRKTAYKTGGNLFILDVYGL